MIEINFHPFPVLHTERLTLREITDNDTMDMWQLRSNEVVMKYIDRPPAKTESEALQHIRSITTALEKNEGISWGIGFKNDRKLIGAIGFWRMQKEHYRAEIGYMLHPDHHRQGIMQEAMEAVLGYGFDTMQLHSVEANINPLNIASAKILEKNKFQLEAHFRENYFYDGAFLDSHIYSLLVSDWKK
jgi:ribosomal-protein-alanine N-acetyltransferase